jgi:hypothetical protein
VLQDCLEQMEQEELLVNLEVQDLMEMMETPDLEEMLGQTLHLLELHLLEEMQEQVVQVE